MARRTPRATKMWVVTVDDHGNEKDGWVDIPEPDHFASDGLAKHSAMKTAYLSIALALSIFTPIGFGADQGDPAPIKAVIKYSAAPWDDSAYEILIPVPKIAEGSDPFIRIDIWGNPEFQKAKSFHFSNEGNHKDGGRAVFQSILNKSSPITLTGTVSFRALQKGQPVFGSFEFADPDGRTLKASFEATWGNKPLPYIR
jgi:hypothetical protein